MYENIRKLAESAFGPEMAKDFSDYKKWKEHILSVFPDAKFQRRDPRQGPIENDPIAGDAAQVKGKTVGEWMGTWGQAATEKWAKEQGLKESKMNENALRQLAGLPTLTEAQLNEKKKAKAAPVDPTDVVGDMAPADDAAATPPADELPAIITKVAKKAEGKTGDDLVALIKKVYDAGVKDGVKQAKAEAKA